MYKTIAFITIELYQQINKNVLLLTLNSSSIYQSSRFSYFQYSPKGYLRCCPRRCTIFTSSLLPRIGWIGTGCGQFISALYRYSFGQ